MIAWSPLEEESNLVNGRLRKSVDLDSIKSYVELYVTGRESRKIV
jgi:hypothetical protein